jgi:TLC ATP/ADP transporter
MVNPILSATIALGSQAAGIRSHSLIPSKGAFIHSRQSLSSSLSARTSSILAVMGGGSGDYDSVDVVQENTDNNMNQPLNKVHHPRFWACLWMAMAMALHFGGYEFVRASSLTLFTSPQTGFVRTQFAIPAAMACVSPTSLFLVWAYTHILERRGPKVALRQSTLMSMGALLILVAMIRFVPTLFVPSFSSVSRWCVALLYIFQNSYAHLLYTQHWSFLGSVCTVEDGARWFATLAGLSSLASTCTGALVEPLVSRVGLYGLIFGTVGTLSLSLLCAERAYRISETHQFSPIRPSHKTQDSTQRDQSWLQNTKDLYKRVPTLQALFYEILSFQCMSTILNVCLVTTLRKTIPNDYDRAGWTGRLYSLINGISALFQFVVLPLGMKNVSPAWVWRFMPVIPLLVCLRTAVQSSSQTPSLLLLAVAFFVTKCCDYSIRGVVTELLYVPLDFESRFVGKEVNGVIANRFGKSGTSVVLSILTAGGFGFSLGLNHLTQMALIASLCWTSCTFWLSCLVTKDKTN